MTNHPNRSKRGRPPKLDAERNDRKRTLYLDEELARIFDEAGPDRVKEAIRAIG